MNPSQPETPVDPTGHNFRANQDAGCVGGSSTCFKCGCDSQDSVADEPCLGSEDALMNHRVRLLTEEMRARKAQKPAEAPVAGVEQSQDGSEFEGMDLDEVADILIKQRATLTSRVVDARAETEAYRLGCESARRDANHWHEQWNLNQTEKINLRNERDTLRAELQSAKEKVDAYWTIRHERDGLERANIDANAEIEKLRGALEVATLPEYPEGPTQP